MNRFGAPLIACLLAGAALLAGCSRPPTADVRYATVDGNRIAYRVLGSGRPVLVMISGLGEGMATFSDVAADLARHATVIVYDRAGYGASGPAAGEVDAATADRELQGLLRASGVRGPYVILGHSLGGLFAQYFAARHPDAVAGLILEDARPPGYSRACAAAGHALCSLPGFAAWLMPPGGRAEIRVLPRTEAQAAASLGADLPVLVLSRARRPDVQGPDAIWLARQEALADAYPRAALAIAPAGGHAIHLEDRTWFVGQVRGFLAQLPAAPAPR